MAHFLRDTRWVYPDEEEFVPRLCASDCGGPYSLWANIMGTTDPHVIPLRNVPRELDRLFQASHRFRVHPAQLAEWKAIEPPHGDCDEILRLLGLEHPFVEYKKWRVGPAVVVSQAQTRARHLLQLFPSPSHPFGTPDLWDARAMLADLLEDWIYDEDVQHIRDTFNTNGLTCSQTQALELARQQFFPGAVLYFLKSALPCMRLAAPPKRVFEVTVTTRKYQYLFWVPKDDPTLVRLVPGITEESGDTLWKAVSEISTAERNQWESLGYDDDEDCEFKYTVVGEVQVPPHSL